jgi:hypothetical protein
MAQDMMDAMQMAQVPEEAGRGTDTVMGHLSLGEVVIPRALLDDPEVMQAVQSIFEAYGVNMAEFTVGDPANKINPETGYPEFFFKKLFKAAKKVLKSPIGRILAPAALSIFAPGIGTALGAGLGAGATAAPIVGNALVGAGLGAVTGGGVKGALFGGLSGGLGGAASSGALGSLGNNAVTRSLGLNPTFGPATPAQVAAAGGNTNAAIAALGRGGASGGGLSSITNLARPASSLFSGIQQYGAQDDMEEQLLAAQGKAQKAIAPYSQLGLEAQKTVAGNLQEGFNPGDLTQDAGYQYRLSQGNEQLQRGLAAQGMSGSGAALKAAQELGQGMASQQYNDAYNQWLQRNSQLAGVGSSGQQAAGTLADIYGNQGNIQANKTLSQSNTIADTMANVLGRRVIGYDPMTGRPIYG